MRIYFAPMEGVTDAVYRNVHHRCFGGVDKYYTPFIAPGTDASLMVRQRRDIDPEQNRDIPLVPQVLTQDARRFILMTERLADMGYTEVNLNVGCPSGTVVGSGRGSALLKDLGALARLLDEIFAHSVLPISVKTRIGFESTDEWPSLLALYRHYPLCELIVHMRTRQEYYRGNAHRELCATLAGLPFPTAFNGDLFTVSDIRALERDCPGTTGAMLGRGLLTNPALAREYRGGAPLSIDELSRFHETLYREYLRDWPEAGVVARLHGVMENMCLAFEDAKRQTRAVLRSRGIEEYNEAIYRLFSECRLKTVPAFDPDRYKA